MNAFFATTDIQVFQPGTTLRAPSPSLAATFPKASTASAATARAAITFELPEPRARRVI
jgi:hypothetical protein